MNVSRTLILSFLTVAFVLFSARARGQGFFKNYSPATSGCRDLVETPDGGFFMAGEIASTGQMFLQKVNSAGTIEWTHHLSLNGARAIALCISPAGNYIVLGENYAESGKLKNIVLQLSPNGDILWQTVVNNTLLPNGLKDVIPTADGNLIAAGNTRDATLNYNIWLVKIGIDGTLLWSKSIGDPSVNEQVSRLLELPDGRIVVSGSGQQGGDGNLFLAKTDANGNLIWQNWYAKPGRQYASDLMQTSDGGILLLGDTYEINPTRITLLKTDTAGTEEQYTQLPGNSIGSLYVINSFARDDADNVYIPGYLLESANTIESVFMLKVDAAGSVVWKNTLVSTQPDIPWQIIHTTDNRFAIGGGLNAPSGAYLIKTNTEGEIYTNKIAGSIYFDANDNCQPDTGEPALTQFIVKARNQSGETFYKNVVPGGTFLMPVSEGDFTLSVKPMYGTQDFWYPCDTQVVTVTGMHQTVQVQPLGLRSLADCPRMYVEVAAPFLRRCLSNSVNVLYCNNGNLTATGASVDLTLSGPELSYESSTIPLSGQTGNVLHFNIPDVAPGDCGTFTVNLVLDCSAELGEVFCIDAHIFPDTVCPAPDPLWDGSHLEVGGVCDGNEVQFTISNTGTGDMTGVVDYVIVEDQIMFLQGAVQLDANEDTVIIIPNPGGGPYFLQTGQRPGHPGLSVPSAIVSPCGGAAASSVLQFPNDDAEPFLSTFCDEVAGSYDPNDKRGFPLGWKNEHYIEQGQELDYVIRFQNTGTDTAFLVVIRDTLSALLDGASLRPGPASHPYAFELNSTGVLVFRFDDIDLVDSATNERASHGYVSFRVSQQPDIATGALIENRASIYFDYNDPVSTNTTFHTVGHPFTTLVINPPIGQLHLDVYPNPFAEEVVFSLPEAQAQGKVRLQIFDTSGHTVREENFNGPSCRLQGDNLRPGVYFFRVETSNGSFASGRLVVIR